MNRLHRLFALVLVFTIGVLPVGEVTAFAASTSPPPDQVKQQINQYGVGANLSVRLADGKKLKGALVSFGDGGFELKTKAETPARQLAYADVTEVKPVKLVYRAKGEPDAVEARRVVLGLGVGHHIQVKTTAGKEYHGIIQTIDSGTFTMLPDRQTAPTQISFSEVTYVEQNLSTGAKVAIIVGIAGAGVLIGLLIWASMD